MNTLLVFVAVWIYSVVADKVALPSFQKLRHNYPGYHSHGGRFTHRMLLRMIGCDTENLLHDTSALRFSVTLNKLGGEHSLGRQPIKLSTYGHDSVEGRNGLQYIYHPLAYGPFLVDKYGYPNISVLHQTDPIATKDKFWGKQGIMEVITYTKKGNNAKGHIVLWDCDHIHQARDWISRHTLITVEFWASPDSDCSRMKKASPKASIPKSVDPIRHLKRRLLSKIKANELSASNYKYLINKSQKYKLLNKIQPKLKRTH
ncbi:uncharacterized protein LOC110462318 [Mizuhopecten yessoensis]|uniref:Uncharacterized protein n=1 Tax=Mizuhopecten yessoensis TaxID=6573 RepID=A0A210PYF4_MIZYE|nr:uncharacterized protein LOC110462318 [Mizuhopecten yessoensis]OWF41516.1 hypothetical protein KP79_PYT17405 [Mizuhopecten yessoensis]